MRRFVLALACLVALTAGVSAVGAATVTPVTSGLDSPRGLAFLPNGSLTVAEAGHGGDVCFDGTCVGTSGRISTIDLASGAHAPFVTGLVSVLDPEGGAIGVDGLSTQGGRLLALMGANPAPLAGASCDGLAGDCPEVLAAARAQLGQLLKVNASGGWKAIAGVGAFDYQFTADNPGGDTYGHEIDSNPYGVLALPSGTFVADAGSNTVDWVGNNGAISIVQRFPVPDPMEPFPTDAVPTCVAQGASGLVVADLAGRIWTQSGGTWDIAADQNGDHYTGCAGDGNGNVYVVSMFHGLFPSPAVAMTGSVLKLAGDGTVTTVASGLLFPNGITVGPDGALYVSVGSICGAAPGGMCGPFTGGVARITP
jgi:hypothetical protein